MKSKEEILFTNISKEQAKYLTFLSTEVLQAMDTHAEQVAEKKLSDFIGVLEKESKTYLYMNEILILFNLFTTKKEEDADK